MNNLLKKIVNWIKDGSIKRQFKKVQCNYSQLIIGPDVKRNFTINYPENLRIGDNTVINGDLYINAFGNVSIGKYCHIAKGLTIFSHNHNYKSTEYIPYDNKQIIKTVYIGDAVWIGANVTIAPGSIINDGAILSMGTVVFGTIEKCAIVRGNPAVVIGHRDIETFDKLRKENKYY